jgi:hypothetical protein
MRGLCSGSGTSGLLSSGQSLLHVVSVMFCVVHGSCSGPRVVSNCLVGACHAVRAATSSGHWFQITSILPGLKLIQSQNRSNGLKAHVMKFSESIVQEWNSFCVGEEFLLTFRALTPRA